MSTASVRPPFTLYRLETEAGTRNSPPEPAVYLTEVDEVSGAPLRTHTLTPEQARELAGGLNAAADEPEPDDPGRDGGDDLAAAHAIVAEGLAYTRDHFSVRPGQFVGQIPVVEYEAALDVVVAGVGDLIAERDRLAAELAAHTRCRHHDGTCSQVVDDNERLGEALAEVTAEREALKAVIREEAVEREQERNERERRRLELLEVTADRGRLTAEVARLRAALAACRSATPERVTGTVAAIVREALDAP